MANFYCEYCGYKASSVMSLTASSCPKHQNGANSGKHSLYQGSEKTQYTCKYCGYKSSTIYSLTGSTCNRHPNGSGKGKHVPAL